MKKVINKHWFLIILIPLLITLIIISSFKLSQFYAYKNASSLEKINAFATIVTLEKDRDLISKELNIIHNKYIENGFDIKNKDDDFFVCLKIFNFINEKYQIFNNMELYLMDNNVQYETREKIFEDNKNLSLEQKILLLNLYYMEHLYPTAKEVFSLNEKDLVTKIETETEKTINENLPADTDNTLREELKETILSSKIEEQLLNFMINYKSEHQK